MIEARYNLAEDQGQLEGYPWIWPNKTLTYHL